MRNKKKRLGENSKKKNKDEDKINKLKKRYDLLKKKYKLPDFDLLNEEFDIEKIEPDIMLLLKSIRRAIFDKFINSAHFLENFIGNPRPLTMFVIKRMGEKDKKKALEIIEYISKLIIEMTIVEFESNEKKEAEAIKKLINEWKKIKDKMLDLMRRIDKELKASKITPKYFG